jgi:16S rRNA G966 N2-methylase RsmD
VNRLYFGDNLKWLRDAREFPDASVDLVYLDPPFNSNADYNVFWGETKKKRSFQDCERRCTLLIT